MTEYNATPDAELVTVVQELSDQLERQAKALQLAAASARRQARRSKWDRVWIIATGVGLVLDFVLSAVFFYQHQQAGHQHKAQLCQNRLAEDLFHAEFAKVSGQIRGIDKVLTDPATGIAEFRAASEHYLTVISALNDEKNC